jgi:hypothetical protein
MSNINGELKATENSNEWDNLIEEVIEKHSIEIYEYKHFSNVQEIGSEVFGKVYRANLKNFHGYLALKSFFNFDNATIKEIVHEVIIITY